MNIKVFQNRKIEKDYFYNEGTQNENKSTVLTFEVPLGYEDFSKRIVFITEDGNFWDYIPENEYEIKNNITKYETVEAYLWLTKDDQDFRSQNFELNFYDNENADDLVPTEEEIDGFKTLIAELDLKIAEVEALKVEIGDFQEALNSKASKKELKEVDDKFDNYYQKTETYNKTEIDNKISVIPKFNRIVVDELPTENIREDAVYLVPSQGDTNDLYREYLYINGNWELIGIQKGDLSNIYTKQEVDEMVKEIQETNEYQSEIIDQFKNEFKQITVSGDSIYIPDAAELPMELVPYGEPVQEVIPEEVGTTVEGETVTVTDGDVNKEVKVAVNGNSYQETTEGYNLFNLNNYGTRTINGVTVTQNKDDSLNANGVGVGNYITFLNNIVITDELEDGETYTLWCNQPNSLLYAQIAVTPLEGSSIYITTGKGISTFKVNKTTNSGYSIRLQSGSNSNGITYNLSNLKFMLLKGKYTADTIPLYEPYTNGVATPNTNHKQDIEVIDGVNRLPIAPKHTYTANNVEISSDGEGGYRIVAETPASDNTYFNFQLDEDYIIQKGDYLHCMNEGISNNVAVALLSSTAQIMYTTPNVENRIIDLSDYEGEPINRFRLYINSGFTADISLTPMITNKSYSIPFIKAGCIGLVQRGKNRLKFKETTTQTSSGLTGTANVDGSFKLNGTTTGTVAMGFNLEPYKVKGTHRASGYTKDGVVQLYWKDKNGTVKYKEIRETTPINFEEGDTLFQVFCWTNKTGTAYNNETFYLQLEEGSEATPFETPVEPIVHSIDLAGNSIAKATLEDNLNIAVSGEVNLTKNAPEYIITGDENWFIDTSNRLVAFNITALLNVKNDVKSLCNIAKWVQWSSKDNSFDIRKQSIYFKNNYNYTLDEFKAMLKEKYNSGNPVKIIFNTENPETIELPSIKPIKLIEGTNIFELVTNLGTTMALTYDYVTPSPSIDRPSEILTVKGSYRTNKQNKNVMLEVEYKNQINEYGPTAICSYRLIKDAYYILSCDTENTGEQIYINYGVNDGVHLIGGWSVNYQKCDGTRKYWVIKGYDSKLYTRKFLINKGAVSIGNTNGVACGYTYNVMLERINATSNAEALKMLPSEYQEPNNTNLPLTLTKELLGEIVTLTEEEATALNLDGAGKYRRTDYVTLNPEELNWKQVDNTSKSHNIIRFSTDITKIKTVMNSIDSPKTVMCNTFDCVYILNAYTQECIAPHNSLLNQVNIFIDKSRLSNETVEDFKQYLSEINCTILAKLATPTYEKITDETELQQLSAYDKQIAFYGINNINTYPTDDLVKAPLGIHATYSKSNKLTIQSLEDRLASLESQVTNLQDNQI